MVKTKTIFICDNCGSEYSKWQGKCLSCKEWNTLKEVPYTFRINDQIERFSKERSVPWKLSRISLKNQERIKTGISEFDRTLGGGIVPGSIILLAGDPGIGKSTLLLQIAEGVKNSLYISGEESIYQIKMRSLRIGSKGNDFLLFDEIDIERVIQICEKEKPNLIIIDSIQSMHDPQTETSSGSVTQVKSCGLKLQQYAKLSGIPIIIVGHITKSGVVAGPKTLEHLVDAVLYLEGDKYHGQRIMRSVKNRFGSTGETGIFKMTSKGMAEVKNPSEIFLENSNADAIGSAITVGIEGTKAILFEVQALCPSSSFGYAKRTASGIDLSRVQLLSAVVSETTRTNLQTRDIYVNLVGGVKVKEPAIDLAVCTALISAAKKKKIDRNDVYIGEVGLTGEIREVSEIERRIREAAKAGFKKVYIPRTRSKFNSKRIKIQEVSVIGEIEKIIEH